RRSRIDTADVPEATEQQAAIHRLDHVVERNGRLRTLHDAVAWSRRRLFTFLFGPEARVNQVLQHAVAYKHEFLCREAGLCGLRAGQFGMPRIAVDVYAFVEDLLAQFRLSARRGERAAALFSTPCVETESKEPEQIGYGLRLQNRGIHAGLENSWVASVQRFANRFVRYARGVEFRNVEVVAEEVTRARAVGCSGGGR